MRNVTNILLLRGLLCDLIGNMYMALDWVYIRYHSLTHQGVGLGLGLVYVQN